MEIARFLHISQYSVAKKRFGGYSFEADRMGEISVVEIGCAIRTSGSVCDHGEKFYREVSSDPIVYVLLETSEFPFHFVLKQETTEKGDECHFNLSEIEKKEAQNYFKKLSQKTFIRFCDGSQPLEPSEQTLSKMSENWKQQK